jgi:hypothetical protein
MPVPKSEKEAKLMAILQDSAVKRFGEERARILEPALQDMVRSLASVDSFPLEMEEEPAFAR